jgi:predicted O-methyltransferase YrrM
MSSLIYPPVSDLLDKLLETAESADKKLMEQFSSITPQEYKELQKKMGDFKTFYETHQENYLAISREFGKFLYLQILSSGAENVIEFGTSFGISTIFIASALRDLGGGKVITTEFLPQKAARAEENIRKAGLSEFVELRLGDAMETLKEDLPDKIDLVLLDGAKPMYLPLLQLLEPSLKKGSVVISDNSSFSSDYLDYVRNPKNGYISMELFENENEFSVRI